jgi:hypothetical protein
MGRLIAAFLVSAGVLLGSVPTVIAASATFGTPSAQSNFGSGIVFTQPVQLDETVASAEILLTFPGAIGPTAIEVKAPLGTGERTLSYDLAGDGSLTPNTTVSAQWRLHLTATPDVPITGPSVSVTYADDRFDWKIRTGDLVRVHWYKGSDAFGARVLKVAEDAVASSSALLGVTETEPIDVFVYATKTAFSEALGPGNHENAGAETSPAIRTVIADIAPNEIDAGWVDHVIPHELTHVVFDTAVSNPYHAAPGWLNEGISEYQSIGYDASYRATVQDGASSGTLIPLDGLTGSSGGQWPTSYDRFALSYAESTAAVDYLVRTYGQDALVSLVRSYASGLTDDEAFTRAVGIDATAFGDAWLASVGAVAPTTYGPLPAAPGPIPAAWQGKPAPGTTAAPDAPATAPTLAPGKAPAPSDTGGTGSAVLLVLVGGVTIAGVLGLYGWRRRQDAEEA